MFITGCCRREWRRHHARRECKAIVRSPPTLRARRLVSIDECHAITKVGFDARLSLVYQRSQSLSANSMARHGLKIPLLLVNTLLFCYMASENGRWIRHAPSIIALRYITPLVNHTTGIHGYSGGENRSLRREHCLSASDGCHHHTALARQNGTLRYTSLASQHWRRHCLSFTVTVIG